MATQNVKNIPGRVKPAPVKENHREYRSPDGEEIVLNLDDGRSARVGEDWRDLPLAFHNVAVREGCEVRRKDGTAMGSVSARDEAPERRNVGPSRAGSDASVRLAMIAALEADEPGLINESTGIPDAALISKRAGFNVSHEQNNRVWKALRQEIAAANAAGRTDLEAADEANEATVRQANAALTASAEAARAEDLGTEDPDAEGGEAVSVDPDAVEKAVALRRKAVQTNLRAKKAAANRSKGGRRRAMAS